MPRYTKAAYLKELGKPLVVESEIEIPNLKPGQVLVKLAYSGVCKSQLMEIRGMRGEDKYLPHMLGHEASGEVVEIGDSVTKVKGGDAVILGWIKGDGMDAGGSVYRKGNTSINAGGVTTFMTHSVVSENRVVKLPKEIPADQAVLLGCAIPTGAGIVLNSLKPKQGSTLVVFGLGGVGLCALMAARTFDLSQLIAVDIDEGKLDLARELGATDCINAAKANVVNAVFDLTRGTGADYAVEASGIPSVIEQAFQSVKRGGGKCVFAGHPPHGSQIQLDPFELICGKSIEGSWGGSSHPDRDIGMYRDLYKNGLLPLEKLLSNRYSLENINQAVDDLEAGRVKRALISLAP